MKRRRAAFSAVALLTLAVTIAMVTVTFSIIDGVRLKPLPYRDPDRLATLRDPAMFGASGVTRGRASKP